MTRHVREKHAQSYTIFFAMSYYALTGTHNAYREKESDIRHAAKKTQEVEIKLNHFPAGHTYL